MVSGAAKRKGQGSGNQPGPNNGVSRGLTKGDAVLKITFAGLLSCRTKKVQTGTLNKLGIMSVTAQTEIAEKG
jgi:hypothetical protein